MRRHVDYQRTSQGRKHAVQTSLSADCTTMQMLLAWALLEQGVYKDVRHTSLCAAKATP